MGKHRWTLIGLIIVGVLIFLWLIKAPIMSSYLTDKMGVPVTVRTISMWPKETTIRHFRIGNPHGFKSRTALEVAKTVINYRWKALRQTPTEIDLITLDRVVVDIEMRNAIGSDNNWAAIGAQMPDKKGGTEVIIHKLVLKDMTVKITGAKAKILGVAGTKHFDRMEFDEIDSRNGFPTKELIRRIFEGAGLMKYLDNFLNPVKQIQKALNPFNIFGSKAPETDLEGSNSNQD